MITDEERERRKRYLGSSDIAAVVGCHPFKNIADLFLEKTDQLVPEVNGGTKGARMGKHLESAILNMFEDAMHVKLERNIWLETGDFCANLDGAICEDRPNLGQALRQADEEIRPVREILERPLVITSPVEAKSTRLIEFWGEEIDEAPVQVAVQVQWQMLLIGPHCRRGYAPVFYPAYKNFGFEHVSIVRDNELIEDLEFAGREFMDAVKRGERPKDVTPQLDTLKRVRREPQSVVSINEDGVPHVKKWREIKERESFLKSDAEHLKAVVLDLIGNAEAGRLPDGAMITFLEQNGARHCDVDLLEHRLALLQDELMRVREVIKSATPGEALALLDSLDAEAIYKATVRQSRHRTLRYKKAPKIRGAR